MLFDHDDRTSYEAYGFEETREDLVLLREMRVAITSGEFVWCHSMAATPVLLLNALGEHAVNCRDVTVMQLHLEHAEQVTQESLDGHLRHRCFFAGRETRRLSITIQPRIAHDRNP